MTFISPSAALFLIVCLRDAKLFFFDNLITAALFVAECVLLFWTIGMKEVVLFQILSMLITTPTVVFYNGAAWLKQIAIILRFTSLIFGSIYFSAFSQHFYSSTSFFLWAPYALFCVYVAQQTLITWLSLCHVKDKNNIVVVMKSLTQKGPFGKKGNMIFWSLFNSLCEEMLSRVILYESLIASGFLPEQAHLIQAFDFGIMHYRYGFPNGCSGLFLSSVFGWSQSLLYYYTGGIFVPWITHAAIDYCIFTQITE